MKRKLEICVRVDEKDKRKLQRNAKNSGLSLSSYLRKVGLKEEIYPIPEKNFYTIYEEINELKGKIFSFDKEQVNVFLGEILEHFRNIYYNKKGDNL